MLIEVLRQKSYFLSIVSFLKHLNQSGKSENQEKISYYRL